jgi:uncharacterized membrane protein YphA (DoxX/SURF4 family)
MQGVLDETARENTRPRWHGKGARLGDNAIQTGIGGSQLNQEKENCMKTATIIVRSLLGLMFIVFGLNIFFNFMPQSPPPEGPARNFITALAVSHYFYVVGALEVAGGALLLAGRFVPFGLTLLGPVIVNILCFHVFLKPSGLPMAIVVSALALFLLWGCCEHFAGLVKSVPTRAERGGQQIVASTPAANPDF